MSLRAPGQNVKCQHHMRPHQLALLLVPVLCGGCLPLPVPYTMRASGVFAGRVVDAQKGTPIQGAAVVVTNYPKTTTLSGANGEFTVGPARKFYWYTVIGFHQHIIPEPEWPTVSTAIAVSFDDYVPVTVHAGPSEPTREIVKQSFEIGDVMLKHR